MNDPMVHLAVDAHLAILTLDRPAALNALSFEIIGRIGELLDEVATLDVRALLITGAGEKAFCAGADIKELRGRDVLAERNGALLGQSTFSKLEALAVPSIAAINGFAFGGGLELALACTFRVASPRARMGLPEIKLGLIPGYGGTQRLPRLVGEARALEMIMTGRTIDADEALRIGLVNRVAPDALDGARALASELAGFGLPALGFAREAVRRGGAVPLADGLRIEADLSTLAYRTHDAGEGMAAFVEKRPARFEDR